MLLLPIIASQTSSVKIKKSVSGLTKKAEPPPTRGVNRDSGTDSANGGWLQRLVRRQHRHNSKDMMRNQLGLLGSLSKANAPYPKAAANMTSATMCVAILSPPMLMFLGIRKTNKNANPKMRMPQIRLIVFIKSRCRLTYEAEPPPTCGVNRDSGTDSANGGWLRRLVRHSD